MSVTDKILFQGEELTIGQMEARLGHLDGLMSHPGWKLIRDLMEREKELLTYRICQPNFPEGETAFSRGAIYAAMKFIDLPVVLADEIVDTLKLNAAVDVQANDPA